MPARVRTQKLRRLPFDPLWPVLADDTPNVRLAAVRLGVTPHAVQGWRRQGLSVWQADRLACRLNLHPLLVWGDEWSAAAVFDELEKVYAT